MITGNWNCQPVYPPSWIYHEALFNIKSLWPPWPFLFLSFFLFFAFPFLPQPVNRDERPLETGSGGVFQFTSVSVKKRYNVQCSPQFMEAVAMSPTVDAESVDGLLYDLSWKTSYAICAVALLETEMIVSGQKTPWQHSAMVKTLKTQCRKAAHKWRKTKLQIRYNLVYIYISYLKNRCFPTFIISKPRAVNNAFLNPLITISIPLQLSLLWLKNLLTRLHRLP